MLLVNYKDIWEPAGRKYDSTATMQVVLREMAREMGIEIKDLNLRALVGKYYNQAQHPILFNYVTAKCKSGKLQVPPGCKDIKWYDIEEGIDLIPFKPMQVVLRKVFSEDEQSLWAGAFRIYTDPDPAKRRMEVIEELYEF